MNSLLLFAFLLLQLLIKGSLGHGAMGTPRPRNNGLTNLTVNYGIKFRVIDGGLAWDDFNVHTCTGGYQTAQEFKWGMCKRAADRQDHLAYKVSQAHPPATHKVVDCTLHNDCSKPTSDGVKAAKTQSSKRVWLSVYNDDNCMSEPTVTYEVMVDICTQFPVSGKNYWTGGCEGYSCMWFSHGCCIGCPNCTGDTNASHYFRSLCGSTKKPTIMDPKFRTINRFGKDPWGDWTSSHPWRAPGSAPVLDACGVAGGFWKNNEGPGGHPPPGHNWGDKGSKLPPVSQAMWKAASVVEVSWAIAANHGGGYQYRLCPKSEMLSEECFQRLPLPFAGNTQKLILSNGSSMEIAGTYVSSGTLPEGSTWAINPVPACSDYIPGHNGKRACKIPQFPPPKGCDETCWGDSDETFHGHQHDTGLPTIVDRLQLPENLELGDYVLGWRWDCEQTPQVWASCSDVKIVRGEHILI